MGLVVPAETHCQIGEIGVGPALDFERGLLQPVPAQHPLHGDADVAPEHTLCGADAPRRMVHHLFDAVQSAVVTHPLEQRNETLIRRVERTGVRPDGGFQTSPHGVDIVTENEWRPEQLIVDRFHAPGHGCGVAAEARGEPAGQKPRADHGAAPLDGDPEHPRYHPVHERAG